MKALLLTEYKQLSIAEMPEPQIGPEELLVRVRACGICGSDVHGYDGSSGRRIPPIVMGHEAAGEVTAVGSAVKGFAPGDRVTFDSTVYCGKCYFCRRGEPNLCDDRQVLGVSCGDYRRHGAFAEFVSVPQHICYKLPADLAYEAAAMIEAVSIAVHAVRITPIELGDSALVVGAGMIGLLTIQALKLAGCARIYAVDLDEAKLGLARQMGATETFNPKNCDVPKELAARTEGRGVALAMEAVGATATVKTAIESVRKGGTVTLIGNLAKNIDFPLQYVVTRQIRLLGSCASAGEYPECIELLASGAIQVDPMISARTPLDQAADWFQRLYNHEPNIFKVIVQP
jgi:L-iditol 2-dehydrogenase